MKRFSALLLLLTASTALAADEAFDVSCDISGSGVSLEARYPSTETSPSELSVSNLSNELVQISFTRQPLDGVVVVEVSGHNNYVAATGTNLLKTTLGLNGGAMGVIDIDPRRRDGEVAPRQVDFKLTLSNSLQPLSVVCSARSACQKAGGLSACGRAIMPSTADAVVPGLVSLVSFDAPKTD